MSMPSANLFIIISSPYATSVPPYDMAKMVACALVGSRLDYAYSVLFGTTQKKNISKLQKAQNLHSRVFNLAVHVLSSNSFTH